jgi:predicted  nucleic acid-binding Zn-ribbon protein
LSALTKIAVVLLVVASLLLSAGVVVFVNKVEHYKMSAEGSETQNQRLTATNRDLTAQLGSANTQLLAMSKDLNSHLDTLKQEVATKDNEVAGLKTTIAKIETDKKGVETALASMTKVQEGQQTQLAGALAQITELRAVHDKLVDERHGLNVQLTDALSKIDALNRAYKNAEERAAGLHASLDALQIKVKNAGFTESTLPNRGFAGTPVLEGVVSSVFNAGNKPWASITIGAKDNVEKGMKFNVVNNSEFLGYLTIQSTEANEATGVLEGPKVEKVHTGDQVKTQLQ